MSTFYLDTSVAVYALLGNPGAARWFDGINASPSDSLHSSRILRTELTRSLRREGENVAQRQLILDKTGTIPVSEAILAVAESIAEHVKTLDAIHLASALALGGDTTMVSHDDNVIRVAANLGLPTFDPLAS